MKILFFIINVAASNGRSIKIWGKLKDELEHKSISYRSFFTKYPGHGTEIAKQITEMYNGKIAGIIAVGGDGTIYEVVNGVNLEANICIGAIPAGSGNDFSRGYKLPSSPLAALELILQELENKQPFFDIGQFVCSFSRRKRYFVNSLGVGFDAEIAKKANNFPLKGLLNKLKLGSLTYVVILLNLLFTYRRTNAEVIIDRNVYRFTNVWFIAVSNQKYYGGGMKISPQAMPNDGLLNITVVYKMSRFKLLAVFISVFWGGHQKFKEVKMMTGNVLEIVSEELLEVHADGENVGKTPVKITIQKRAMQFFSPFHN